MPRRHVIIQRDCSNPGLDHGCNIRYPQRGLDGKSNLTSGWTKPIKILLLTIAFLKGYTRNSRSSIDTPYMNADRNSSISRVDKESRHRDVMTAKQVQCHNFDRNSKGFGTVYRYRSRTRMRVSLPLVSDSCQLTEAALSCPLFSRY